MNGEIIHNRLHEIKYLIYKEAKMLFGALIFATEYAMHPAELAKALEERGFESLWVPEHTHIPVSRRSPWPDGKELPKEYWHTYDPFVALTAAAMATSRLRIATGICLVIKRDPIITAKEVASLDQLSGGRFIFGIGGGWNAEEMENHGTDFRKRWRVLRERVLAMKEIWTQDEPQYHGEFVNFDRIWSHPKPKQKPHPPILMGGDSPKTFDRVIEFCDGWIPIVGTNPAVVAEKIAILHKRAEEAGRDPKQISVSLARYRAEPDRRMVDELEKIGVERVVITVPSANKETLLPLLDKYAVLIS
jgi:probable F420-dependent oxidoreductase